MATKTEIEYLSIPYSHFDALIRKHRFEIANKIAADLMKKGRIIFSPISHCHPLTDYGLPGSWDYWKNYNREFLKICKKLIVVRLEGWEESVGVTEELKIAEEEGLVIEYIDPAPYL